MTVTIRQSHDRSNDHHPSTPKQPQAPMEHSALCHVLCVVLSDQIIHPESYRAGILYKIIPKNPQKRRMSLELKLRQA